MSVAPASGSFLLSSLLDSRSTTPSHSESDGSLKSEYFEEDEWTRKIREENSVILHQHCKMMQLGQLKAIQALWYHVINEPAAYPMSDWLRAKNVLPISFDIEGERYKFSHPYDKGRYGDWIDVFTRCFDRDDPWAINQLKGYIAERVMNGNEVNVSTITPVKDVQEHNRRLVSGKSIPQKMAKAFTFAQSTLPTLTFEIKENILQKLLAILASDAFKKANFKSRITTHDGSETFESKQLFPNVPDDVLKNLAAHCGYSKCMGQKRRVCEDAVLISTAPNYYRGENLNLYLPVLGIFDGHGGPACSKFLSANFMPRLLALHEALSYSSTHEPVSSRKAIFNFLKLVFITLAQQYRRCVDYQKGHHSTATVVVPFKNGWYVACCGDSRAIRVKDGTPIVMSIDANLENQRDPDHLYSDDVRKRGGIVTHSWEIGFLPSQRVHGINMTRAVAHPESSGVNPRPKILNFWNEQIAEQNDWLIVASDGLWGDVTTVEASLLVDHWGKEGVSAEEISQKLTELALFRGSTDDISVIVLNLSAFKVAK